jgi:hypothetical protein
MTGTWKTMTQHQRVLTERVFDALSTLDEIGAADHASGAGKRQVGFADIYAYVHEPDRPMSAQLSAALEADERLRNALLRLLTKTADYRCPRSAAAGTKALESRDGHGFTIRLRPSRAEPSQLYVVIELLDHIADTPKALFVAQHPKGLLKHDLPEARGGTVQLLVETESDLVRILQDPGSEVFLL